MRFYEYAGDLIGLPTSKTHKNFRWAEPDCKILASVTQVGNAVSSHFASDKKGLRKLKEAIKDFESFCFGFLGAKMIIAKIKKPSVERLMQRCGFYPLFEIKNIKVWGKKNG